MRRRVPTHVKLLRHAWTAVQALAVLCAAVGSGWMAYDYFRQQQYLVVKNVKVQGNVRIPVDELLDYAQVPMGAPLYRAETDAVQQNLALHPDIRTVSVRRVPPDTLVLELQEHEPVATVATSQGAYVVNADGRMFRRAQPGEALDLPVITGIPAGVLASDPARVNGMLREAVDALAAWTGAGRDAALVAEVEVDEPFGVVLRTGSVPTEVVLGRGNLARKLAQLAAVERDLAARHQEARGIHLANDLHPERVALLALVPPNPSAAGGRTAGETRARP